MGMFDITLRESGFGIIPLIIISIIAILVCVNQMITEGIGWFEILATVVVLIIGALALLLIFSAYGSATIGSAFGILAGFIIPFIIFLFIFLGSSSITEHHSVVGIMIAFVVIIIWLEIVLGIILGIIEISLRFPLIAFFAIIVIALVLIPEWQGNFFLLLAVLLLLCATSSVIVCIGVVVYPIGIVVGTIVYEIPCIFYETLNSSDKAQTFFVVTIILGLIVIFSCWIYSISK